MSETNTTEEPIATYREKRVEGSCVYQLFPDRLQIGGNEQLSSKYKSVIPLRNIEPSPTHIWHRNNLFHGGVWMLLAAVVIDTILVSGFGIPAYNSAVGLVGCIGMGGFVLMLATARKVEFATFSSAAGVAVLGIARSGPDAAHFDSFVDLVSKHITQCKQP